VRLTWRARFWRLRFRYELTREISDGFFALSARFLIAITMSFLRVLRTRRRCLEVMSFLLLRF